MVMTSNMSQIPLCKPFFLVVTEELRTHEASGVGGVGPDLAIDLDQALHDNRQDFLAGQGILQPVTKKDRERKRLPELVGARRWTRSL